MEHHLYYLGINNGAGKFPSSKAGERFHPFNRAVNREIKVNKIRIVEVGILQSLGSPREPNLERCGIAGRSQLV